MGAVTFPQQEVIRFINKNLIPVRVAFNDAPLATDFGVKWTPTLINLDKNGKEHHRTVGFLPPDEFIPSLILGLAKECFNQDNYAAALEKLQELLSAYLHCDAAPEAVYLRGVSLYKQTGAAGHLKKAYETLAKDFPDNEWTKRAYPYRLL